MSATPPPPSPLPATGDSLPAMDPADALHNVVDDDQPNDADALMWAKEQLLENREPESVAAELETAGWPAAAIDKLLLQALAETRDQRGVLTRERVMRDLNMDYRKSTAGLAVTFRSGLFGLYGFTTGFMSAWRTARRLRQMRRNR